MADSVSEARKLLSTRRTQLVGELERVEQALAALGGRRRGRKPGPKPGSKRRGRPPGSGRRKPGPKPKKR